jgi:hypothetical protein
MLDRLHIPVRAPARDHAAMTAHTAASRLVLLRDERPVRQAQAQPLRRYRLARVRLEGRRLRDRTRFEYLKRTYD